MQQRSLGGVADERGSANSDLAGIARIFMAAWAGCMDIVWIGYKCVFLIGIWRVQSREHASIRP